MASSSATLGVEQTAEKVKTPSVGIAIQIPRNSLALLMVAQLAVIVPLAASTSVTLNPVPWIFRFVCSVAL